MKISKKLINKWIKSGLLDDCETEKDQFQLSLLLESALEKLSVRPYPKYINKNLYNVIVEKYKTSSRNIIIENVIEEMILNEQKYSYKI